MEVVGYIILGLVAGGVSAALGVGGGVVLVPGLAILFAFDQHLAQGTSLAVIVPIAIVGAVVHARARRVVWKYTLALGITAIVGGQLALALDDSLLRRLFAGMLVVTALRMMKLARAADSGE
jgi:uncharacterized membrane protein YfcA